MHKNLKISLISLGSFFGVILLILISYVAYISIQYYRIEDLQDLSNDIISNSTEKVKLNNEYKISTYNIGFGAYNRDFSFFMDTGVMKSGEKVKGTGSKAQSREVVLNNTEGAISLVNDLTLDFMLFQEVDLNSTRSYHINQYQKLINAFPKYDSVIAQNFHSAYLAYPLFNHHGKSLSGIVTMSQYQMLSSVRHQLPVDNSFIEKFFDLDRCFNVSRFMIEDCNQELVIINVHLSAYDEGGKIRSAQWEILKGVLETEYSLGNYVIVGGDFNHDIANSLNSFETEQNIPEWVQILSDDELPEGYRFSVSNQHPTCRSSDMPFNEGVNYTVVLDGFITSNNVKEISVENIVSINDEDVNFMFSDHNPVVLTFVLGE